MEPTLFGPPAPMPAATSYIQSLHDYLSNYADRHLASTECGGNAENLHVQCVATLPIDPEAMNLFKKKIKEALGFGLQTW